MDITIALVRAWGPCAAYTDAQLAELAAGRESLTPLEACDLPIPGGEVLWLLLREEILGASQLRQFGCDCVTRVLLRERASGREPDPRSWAAVDVSRRFAQGGATEAELAAAWAAAWDTRDARAAWAAAWDTRDAAWVSWKIGRLRLYLAASEIPEVEP